MASVQQIDSTFNIVTPENIAFEYQVAGLWQRLPAFFIDFVVRAAIFVGVGFVLMCAGIFASVASFSSAGIIASLTFILLLWFLLEWFYGGLLETFWNGQTIGKRAFGLRVVTTAGEPINGLQAILRNILRFVDAMPMLPFAAFAAVFGWDPMAPPAEDDPFVMLFVFFLLASPIPTYLLGLTASALNERRQRLGDLVCGTMVIAEQPSWTHGMVRMDDRRVLDLAAQLPPHIDIGRSTAKALAVYVERRQRYSPARRQEIAMHLGHPLIQRLFLPPVSDHDLLLCAIYYKVFITDKVERPSSPPISAAPQVQSNPYLVQEAPKIVTGPSRRRW